MNPSRGGTPTHAGRYIRAVARKDVPRYNSRHSLPAHFRKGGFVRNSVLLAAVGLAVSASNATADFQITPTHPLSVKSPPPFRAARPVSLSVSSRRPAAPVTSTKSL